MKSVLKWKLNRSKKKKSSQKTEQRIVKSIEWKIKENIDVNERSGIYFLRTSLEENEKIHWDSYNTIRQVESTIRCLKTDLDLRPVYHKNDDASLAHLHPGLIAYQMVNTIRYQLKIKPVSKKGLDEYELKALFRSDWREIVRIMNTQKIVTSTAQNKQKEIIILRKCSQPGKKVKQIYEQLAYRFYPFKKKKFVVHKVDLEKMKYADYLNLESM